MKSKPWLIGESNWKEVREYRYEIAVLPWGATEPHNTHLPYTTDNYQVAHIAGESARIAWEKGIRVAVLPVVPYGVQTGMAGLPFAINMNPSTQAAVLKDIVVSLEQQGIEKMLILNGHGGNCFRQMIRELQPERKMFLCQMNWYTLSRPGHFFDEPGDHAGEMETSLMMHLYPDLVRPLSEAGDGAARSFRIKALKEGRAWAPRVWTQVTNDTGVGNPARAHPEKGKRYLDALCAEIAGFLEELADAEPGNLYETGDG